MKNMFRVVVAALAVCAAGMSRAAAKSSTLECAGYTGTTTLTGFQVLVKLSEGAYGFSYSDYAAADGSDLWFEDANGTLIPHEIDTWNPSGDSFVWVKIPSVVPSTDANFPTAITMHWGAARTAGQTCTATDTWSDFVGVWHIGKTVSGAAVTPTELDSTGNGLDAYAIGANASAIAAMTATTGIVGDGRVNALNNGLQVPDYRSYISDETKFTMSGWWSGNSDKRFFSARGNPADGSYNDYWELYGGLRNMVVAFGNGTAFQDKQDMQNSRNPFQYKGNTSTDWTYITLVYNGTQATLYVNGAQAAAFTASITNAAPTWGFKIGNINTAHGWVGNYDEVRMYNGVSSADRAMADYATMNDPMRFLRDVNAVVAATWTGAANNNDLGNPQNWNCKNRLGNVVQGALPTNITAVTFSGSGFTLQFPNGFSHGYQSIGFSNCVLGADCDWRGLSDFTIDGTVNLNGHNLYLAKLQGSGEITDGSDSDELVRNGSFEGYTFSNENGYVVINALSDWTLSHTSGFLIVRPGYDTTNTKASYFTSSPAPQGTNVLFINPSGDRHITQSIQVTTPGKYIVSLWYVVRKDYRNNDDLSGATITMQVDGNSLSSVVCRECINNTDEREFRKFCAEVDLTAGRHELKVLFKHVDGKNEGIDFVSVRPAGGELHLDSDSNVENSTVSLTGTLRLVKEGSGTFTATKARQSYAGGTEILKGTVRPGIVGSLWPFGAENSEILISTNNSSQAVFEMNTKNNFYGYRFVLNGGKLQNYLTDIGASLSQIKNIRLTADSDIYVRHNFGLTYYTGDKQTVLDLGGHTLSLNTDSGRWFILANTVVSNGTINATGGGGVLAHKAGAVTNPRVEASTASFNISVGFGADVPVSLRDYMVDAVNPSLFQGTCTVEVSRVFSPVSDKFHNTLLLDGATLDLSSRTGTLASTNANSRAISFAAGSTITVNLAGRSMEELKALKNSASPYLVTWPSMPDATFVLDSETSSSSVFKLRKEAEGLRLSAAKGLMIIVK